MILTNIFYFTILLISSNLISLIQGQDTNNNQNSNSPDYASLPTDAKDPKNDFGLQINYGLKSFNNTNNKFWADVTIYHNKKFKDYSNYDKKFVLSFRFKDNGVKVERHDPPVVDQYNDDYIIRLKDDLQEDKSVTIRIYGGFKKGLNFDNLKPNSFKVALDGKDEFKDLEEKADYFYSTSEPIDVSRNLNQNSTPENKVNTNTNTAKQGAFNKELAETDTGGMALVGLPIGLIIYSAVFTIGATSYLSGTIVRLRCRQRFRSQTTIKA
ncbi:hypothetical protein K502DRAFT_325635 [Neoconidiobolus thromboides FSU 785]|nr:hypothetical protein K502DRAFT_325635 [Neoconidiobolus thromboides FSU 785]